MSLPQALAIEPNLDNPMELAESSVSWSVSLRGNAQVCRLGESASGEAWGGDADDGAPNRKSCFGRGPGIGEGSARELVAKESSWRDMCEDGGTSCAWGNGDRVGANTWGSDAR